jgi:hypothetical protein
MLGVGPFYDVPMILRTPLGVPIDASRDLNKQLFRFKSELLHNVAFPMRENPISPTPAPARRRTPTA